MASMRKIAQKIGINYESIRLIAKNELWLKTYKLQKCQLLTDEHKKIRLERCRLIQRRAAGTGWKNRLHVKLLDKPQLSKRRKLFNRSFPIVIRHSILPKSAIHYGM